MSEELNFEFNDYVIAIDEPYENDCGYVVIGKKQSNSINIVFKSLNKGTVNWFIELQKYITDLQSQLDQANERLKYAIVPKFKIGQEAWVVREKIMTESYVAKFKVKAFIPDRYGIVLMLENEMGDIHYCYEWQVYITREEAEKKLKELRGGE